MRETGLQPSACCRSRSPVLSGHLRHAAAADCVVLKDGVDADAQLAVGQRAHRHLQADRNLVGCCGTAESFQDPFQMPESAWCAECIAMKSSRCRAGQISWLKPDMRLYLAVLVLWDVLHRHWGRKCWHLGCLPGGDSPACGTTSLFPCHDVASAHCGIAHRKECLLGASNARRHIEWTSRSSPSAGR